MRKRKRFFEELVQFYSNIEDGLFSKLLNLAIEEIACIPKTWRNQFMNTVLSFQLLAVPILFE